jgi:hypothetical protein
MKTWNYYSQEACLIAKLLGYNTPAIKARALTINLLLASAAAPRIAKAKLEQQRIR